MPCDSLTLEGEHSLTVPRVLVAVFFFPQIEQAVWPVTIDAKVSNFSSEVDAGS